MAWVRSSAVLGTLLGGLAVQGTLLVSGISLARALGPEARGHLALIILVVAIAAQVGALGIPNALTYVTARLPSASHVALEDLRLHLWRYALVASGCASGILLALGPSAESPEQVVGLLMLGFASAGIIAQQCGLALLQGLRRFAAFNVLRAMPNGLFALVAVSLALLGVSEFWWFAVAFGASQIVIAPLTFAIGRSEARRTASRESVPPKVQWVLGFGRKSLLGATPPTETFRLDQSVVALFLPVTSLGFYMVALTLTNLPRFVAQSFGLVATPAVASKPTHADASRAMWKFVGAATPAYLAVVSVLWLSAPTLIVFCFGAEFERSAQVTRLLLISTALFCARRVLADASRGAGFSGAGSIAETASLVSLVPAFALFVPLWQLDGVAYALIVSAAVALGVLIYVLLRANRRGEVPSGWYEAEDVPSDLRPVGTISTSE